MKKFYEFIKGNLSNLTLAAVVALMFLPSFIQAQEYIPLSPRRSAAITAGGREVYTIKGDFQTFGNSNMFLSNPASQFSYTQNNGLNALGQTHYVDVRKSPSTAFNTSSATLQLDTCEGVVFAGLYWGARVDQPNNTFIVEKDVCETFALALRFYDTDTIPFRGDWTWWRVESDVQVIGQGTGAQRYTSRFYFYLDNTNPNTVSYILDMPIPDGSSNIVVEGGTGCCCGNGGNTNRICNITYTKQLNEKDILATVYTNENGVQMVSINFEEVTINLPSGYTLKFSQIDRPLDIYASQSVYKINSFVTINDFSRCWHEVKTYNKARVKIRHESDPYYYYDNVISYQFTEIIDYGNDIFFSTDADYLYAGYADITDIVRAKGSGEYTIGDIACLEGIGGDMGYCAGWGMVVVYENSNLPWKDVMVYDGFDYVNLQKGHPQGEFTVNGFHSKQDGDIDVKISMLALEGDIAPQNDWFAMQYQSGNTPSGAFAQLGRDGKIFQGPGVSDFFNCQIQVPEVAPKWAPVRVPPSPEPWVGTPPPYTTPPPTQTQSNPAYPGYNNPGVDIVNFELDNSNHQFIGHGQTSVNFRYGADPDNFVLYCFAMSVNAYMPMPEAINLHMNTSFGVNGNVGPDKVSPGDTVYYTVDIRNVGVEAIDSLLLVIPIPYTGVYYPEGSYAVCDLWNLDSLAHSALDGVHGVPPDDNNCKLNFNPTVVPNGQIEWYVGDHLYISPVDSSIMTNGKPKVDSLARLVFALIITEDCDILQSPNDCSPQIVVTGSTSGRGHSSNIFFDNWPMYYGYQEHPCESEYKTIPEGFEIKIPVEMCEEPEEIEFRELALCSSMDPTDNFITVRNHFELGVRFFDMIDPETLKQHDDAHEYTISTGFPMDTLGEPNPKKFYAVSQQPGSTCFWPFYVFSYPIPDVNIAGGGQPVFCEDASFSLEDLLVVNKELGLEYIMEFYDDPYALVPITSTDTILYASTTFYARVRVENTRCFTDLMPVNVMVISGMDLDGQYITTQICHGETFSVDPSEYFPDIIPISTLYTWDTPLDDKGITGPGLDPGEYEDVISGMLFNETGAPQIITYTIRPDVPTVDESDTCKGYPFRLDVIVYPRITTPEPDTVRVCTGDAAELTDAMANAPTPTDEIYYRYYFELNDTEWLEDTYIINVTDTHTYYVAKVIVFDLDFELELGLDLGPLICEGDRKPFEVEALLNQQVSNVHITLADPICEGNHEWLEASPITGATIYWFDAPVGGTPLGSGNKIDVTLPAVDTVTTVCYYAEARFEDEIFGCNTKI
ncbi:MAG: hypothetical protein LBU83_04705, partial [Bacteroidales bacterium]|nr:hypothetical protein [Bacteroidales bacterium]